MTSHIALAAAATVLAVAFALSTWERWLVRRRRHELAWTIALALFALGAAALLVGAAGGWTPASFRAFYLFGAILNVPFLALGTVYLLAGRRVGDVVAVVLALGAAFAAGVLVSTPLTSPVPVDTLPQGSEVLGVLPRVLAAVASSVGALVVFGGAAWSATRLLRGGGRPGGPPVADARRLAGANGLIAAGTAILSSGGLANSVLDEMTAFAVTLVAGVGALYAGFLLATAPAITRAPAPARRRAPGAGPAPGTAS